MIPRKTLGSGISGAVRYVLGEGKRDPATGVVLKLEPGAASRVAWTGGTGFGFPIDSAKRLDVARRLMEWSALSQASKTKQCREDCLHLVLSWNPGENPSRAEMEAAAHGVLRQLGMANARAIFAAHDDTAHRHLHLVISRIDPSNGKAFPDRFDTLMLSAWALQWERDHGGVRCEARLDRERQQAERDPEKVIAAFIARRETFTAFDLNRELTRSIPAREARRAFIAEVLARPEMVTLADPGTGQVLRTTTRQTLAAEHLATGSAGRLHADASHAVSALALDQVIEGLRSAGTALRPDQIGALRHATQAEGLGVIAGKAGTGKSFTMMAIAAAYQAEGYAVQSLAPTNKVAAALRRDGLEAATLHSALGQLDRGTLAWTSQTVVMVDEAGMVSTRLMARLLSHAEHAGAKIILLGDDKQLASMDRGGLYAYLADRHGRGELSEITRQHGAEQRELARRASVYDFKGALTALEGQGGLVTAATAEDRIAAAAELWGRQRATVPDASLFVIAVSNAEAQAANLAIRAIRRGRGELGPDHILATADGPQAFAVGDRTLFSGSAATRQGRDAGLVNGNAGQIAAIEGARVSVALDDARPGAVVSFTVGHNREAGEFDALRHGYAGTVYKAQGATYDDVIVIDSPNMRASTAYVALSRHRDTVSVVTARSLQPGFESWMTAIGGIAALTEAQQVSAAGSYTKWRDANPDAGRRHDLADYVTYVQTKEAERRAPGQTPGDDVAEMSKRWSRVEDRRAASRFEALDYTPPPAGRLTPAEVRAAVGAETFELGQAVSPDAAPVVPSGSARVPGRLSDPDAGPSPRVENTRMDPQHSLSEDLLNGQAAREAVLLRELQDQEQRAQAFRRARELEAEEAKKAQAEQKARDEARSAQEGDIANASSRYAIALGENYNVRDPYASLARAAMSEYAMFHRNQEAMRAEMAAEADPNKRRVIELRRQIEGSDYMAITSALIETVQARVEAGWSERGVTGSNDNAVPERAAVPVPAPEPTVPAPLQAAPIEATPPGATVDTPTIAPLRQVVEPEASPPPTSEASPEKPDAARSAPATVNTALSRPDVIAAPVEPHVTRAKDADPAPVPPAEPQAAMPWFDALRRRVAEAETSTPGQEVSDNALAKLARRLESKDQDQDKATDKGKDGPDAGPEPDL